ncbi:MAG TPA: hypothetical protein VK324_16165, partial [Tepidisphaeraceae bacterium]|nr:hypothetical protein [Tepidisphaeraceae bacterium]
AALARPAPPHVVAAACRTAGDATAPGTVAATVDATGTAMRLVAVAKAAAAVIGVLTMVALAVGVILAATTRPTALPKPPPPPAALRDDAGAVVSAGDVIVDVRLPPGVKPKVFATVACPETGAVATILQRLDAETVRCATSVDGEWPVGAEVVYMGECSSTTVPPERLAAVVAALAAEAKPVDAKAFVETGIKAVDLLSPVTRGGTLAVHGPWPGAGKTVVVSELLHRLGDRPDATTIIAFTSPISAATMFNELDDGVEYPAPVYRGERGGRARLAWVLTDASAADTAPGGPAPDGAAAALVLSLVTAAQDLWPAVDVAASRSVALDAAVVGAEHCDVARRVRECVAHANELLYATAADDPRPAKRQDLIPWLAKRYTDRLPRLSPDDRLLVARARKLQRFFTQPLHVAEPMNRRPGVSVPVAETIRGCREILDGKLDDVAEERFIFKGTIDDVRAVQR